MRFRETCWKHETSSKQKRGAELDAQMRTWRLSCNESPNLNDRPTWLGGQCEDSASLSLRSCLRELRLAAFENTDPTVL